MYQCCLKQGYKLKCGIYFPHADRFKHKGLNKIFLGKQIFPFLIDGNLILGDENSCLIRIYNINDFLDHVAMRLYVMI